MSDKIKFDKLSKDAQQKAIDSFMPFYLKLLRNNNLEVMSTFDVGYDVMAEINREIDDVSNDNPQEILKDVIHFNFDDIQALMGNLTQTYFDNGNPSVDWDQWYKNETDKLSSDYQ